MHSESHLHYSSVRFQYSLNSEIKSNQKCILVDQKDVDGAFLDYQDGWYGKRIKEEYLKVSDGVAMETGWI